MRGFLPFNKTEPMNYRAATGGVRYVWQAAPPFPVESKVKTEWPLGPPLKFSS
jgi:hypothetical protein